eukprot:COSAG02_NODE_186_length_30414_cov_24.815372_12_plen_976_part_00
MATVLQLLSLSAALVAEPAQPQPAVPGGVDPLWLRYPQVAHRPRLLSYRQALGGGISVSADGAQPTSATLAQLRAATAELERGLSGLLGQRVPASCCVAAVERAEESDDGAAAGRLVVSVSNASSTDRVLGSEGFRIGRSPSGHVTLRAASSSGVLYGTFRLLSYLQRGEPLPANFTSVPAMKLRVFDLWDELDGSITRGFAGRSLIWPFALFDDARPPPRKQLYLAKCNTSDPYQSWEGGTLTAAGSGKPSTIKNLGTNTCLGTLVGDPTTAGTCGKGAALFLYNSSNTTVSVAKGSEGAAGHGLPGACLDLNGGTGPDIDLWECHPRSDRDYLHQQFVHDRTTGALHTKPDVLSGACLTFDRSQPPPPGTDDPWDGRYKARVSDMLRLLKSAGMNGVALEDVNSCGIDTQSIDTPFLKNVTINLAPLFERWGLTPYLSVCYAAPTVFNNVTTDPLSPLAEKWWADKADEIWEQWPGFGGFLVKADSEGNSGPQSYNRTEADGANLLARAVAPHNGLVMWRAFVYGDGEIAAEDLARQSFDTFMPLDGKFDENVVVQIKNGPMDFQVREPLHPLLGGLKHTNVMMETQATQEYTGQGIHVVSLTKMWSYYMNWDTLWWGVGSTIGRLLSGELPGARGHGMACISNLGNWANWTGSVLVASNTYGCGRLGWDPTLSSAEINAEWTAMTFPPLSELDAPLDTVVSTVTSILERSWQVFEGYTSPLGVGFLEAGGGTNTDRACAQCASVGGGGPCTGKWLNSTYNDGKGANCPQLICPMRRTRPDEVFDCVEPHTGGTGPAADHYWLDPCTAFGWNNATQHGFGCDRSATTGTGYASMYSPLLREQLEKPGTTPLELMGFFHNLPWQTPLVYDIGNGTENGGGSRHGRWRLATERDDSLTNGVASQRKTLLEYIQDGHAAALAEATVLAADWASLEGLVDGFRFKGVQARFLNQIVDATTFKELLVGYWTNLTKAGK